MTTKTGKRELAWVFAGVLCYEIFIGNTEMVSILVWPFVTFIAAAASIHTYGQLLKDGSAVFTSRRRS